MTTKIVFLPIIILLNTALLQAQSDKIKPIKYVKVSSVYAQIGAMPLLPNTSTVKEFDALAPQSELMKKINNIVTNNNYFYVHLGTSFSALASFKFANKNKTGYKENREFRLGISSYHVFKKSMDANTQSAQRVDTIISSQTGTRYIDSVTYKSYNLNYRNMQIRLDGAFIFRTNPASRWNLYGGIGLTFGISINAHTTITENLYSSNQVTGTYNYSYQSISNNPKTEIFNNKKSLNGSVYIPLGIDFRLGRSKEPWSKTHLYIELRPSLEFINIPELKTYIYDAVQASFGFRVRI